MFTGLIQRVSEIASRQAGPAGGGIAVRRVEWPHPLQIGESIAINGVCLTLAGADGDTMTFDVLRETLERTALGEKKPGSTVNLERSLRVGDAMGGHMVAGHVDGIGKLDSITTAGRDRALRVSCEASLLSGMVVKGSVACDGVSLTIVSLDETSFTVHVIPHTWRQTAFAKLRNGDEVNIETDIVGKYVRRFLGSSEPVARVTWETLRTSGFTT